jgi:hypothetical protein
VQPTFAEKEEEGTRRECDGWKRFISSKGGRAKNGNRLHSKCISVRSFRSLSTAEGEGKRRPWAITLSRTVFLLLDFMSWRPRRCSKASNWRFVNDFERWSRVSWYALL